ncbi:MAG: hypothetical protein AVDCRST_MAG11-3477 [uncultured Gemmatimonadaceae bacterium]|uniref:Uncharacterized protein n=1 Tax=uncultured Gemmatimonadaceae bacterium TaxID=246130 RepID=A0A6J4M5R6_9BACT|nr:MAG: hypothetical protein AVDCRST_MAG11-3477 [uncultured Gemmatimonadaceae bacterium]
MDVRRGERDPNACRPGVAAQFAWRTVVGRPRAGASAGLRSAGERRGCRTVRDAPLTVSARPDRDPGGSRPPTASAEERCIAPARRDRI